MECQLFKITPSFSIMKIVVVPHPVYPKAEVVERKGLGHPDTLCDGIAEAVSRALSKEYIKETGNIRLSNG